MTSDQELFTQVENAVRAVLNTKPGEIQPSSSLVKDLGAESIDFLDISCELEKLVGSELDFKEVMRAKKQETGMDTNDLTIQDVINFLKSSAK